MITGLQVKLARTALGWSAPTLANAAGVATNTVSRFENDKGANVATMTAFQATLEAAGVQFIDDGERIGVTVAKASQSA
ncbi:MAG: transcriptional regulator [Pseudomonadota bacterium]